jgi:hypothetical protein
MILLKTLTAYFVYSLINFSLYVVILAIMISCCTINLGSRSKPIHTGVDPKFTTLVDEYLSLARDHGIKFHHSVTIGFNKLDGIAVGETYYGSNFREIDIDTGYWNSSTSIRKMALLWHELGHAYCTRMHDYGDGREYLDPKEYYKPPPKLDGRFPDYCPLSLMFPIVIGDECVKAHYAEYVDEMFNRCRPY